MAPVLEPGDAGGLRLFLQTVTEGLKYDFLFQALAEVACGATSINLIIYWGRNRTIDSDA